MSSSWDSPTCPGEPTVPGRANLYVFRDESMGAAVKMPVVLDGRSQQFTLSVPTEEDGATTTRIELTAFAPSSAGGPSSFTVSYAPVAAGFSAEAWGDGAVGAGPGAGAAAGARAAGAAPRTGAGVETPMRFRSAAASFAAASSAARPPRGRCS